MEKLQRRLRLFIVLAMLSGLATAVFVGKAHAQTSTADQVTIQDLGLDSAPANGGLGAWWDNLTDKVHLALTFGAENQANLELKLAAKSLSRLSSASTPAKAEALLVKYRAAIADAAAHLSKSNSASAQENFLKSILAHQAYLEQLVNSGSPESKEAIELTRGQNWDKLNAALQSLSPQQLAAKLQNLQGAEPGQILRQAALLREWQAKLSPEQQQQLETVVQALAEKLRTISPTQAAALAERIRTLSTNAAVQASIGKLLEQVQPSLEGLAKQLAEPRQPNQKPGTSIVPQLPVLNVTIVALTPQQLEERQHELADATTKDQLLALRQEWYSSQVLYRQLYQFHHSLLDQLNAKLVKAMGKGPKEPAATTPKPDPDAGVTPLPTQQLTPEQQAMGQAFISQQGYDMNDLPPPATSY